MNKKVYIIIGVVVILLLVLYLGVGKRNQTNIPTKNPPVAVSNNPVLSRINYKNVEYGFVMNLPESWDDFTTIEDEWVGDSLDTSGQKQVQSEKGTLISIRHPDWDYKSPRQDIPIMVFTLRQWSDMQADKFHIGAAPINPGEIGRNKKYVFAIPARYNFAYLIGFEEVDQIIRGDNFFTF